MSDVMERLAALEQKVAALDTRMATNEGQFDFVSRQLRDLQLYMHTKLSEHDSRFDEIKRRFEQVDRRFEQIDRRFEHVERRFDRLEAKVDAMPRAIVEALREERKS